MNRVHAKKKLGQHFLIDEEISRQIANTIDVCPQLPVLEVGPGMGALSQFLLPKDRNLKVVELDSESISYLKENIPPLRGRIIEGDFLQMDLTQIFEGKPFVLTGNYPYNISSQIFFKMLDFKDLIPCCTGMLQKEVAERLCSPPGKKAYGILSVLLQAWYNVEFLFTVPPSMFNPPPKVQSAVVRFTRNDVSDLGCNEKLFKRLIKTVFNQRRKMMRGSIRPLLSQLDAENGTPNRDHTLFLSQERLTLRPEQLSVAQFVGLTNSVAEECN